MKIFLKLKAWQLFTLLFGPHLLMMMAVIMTGGGPRRMVFILPLPMIVFLAVFMAWFWSLGVHINQKVPEEIRPSSRYFRIGLAYSSIYMIAFVGFFVLTASGNSRPEFFAFIFPFHLFAMFCLFYALYFVAKNFVMAERQKTVEFYDCAGPFFLLWLYPIGVWFIQPRINRMFQDQ